MTYEEIEHTADLAIKVAAPTFSDLLMEAAAAVMELSGIVLQDKILRQESITLKAEDPETLLVSWLEELLFAIEVKHAGYRDCQLKIAGEYLLHATITSASIKSLQRMIKAVTFHDLSVERKDHGFETVIVFDV
ncbi:MAG: archease [Anaerolineales bacterium]|jgi:SHS2 domain-containing protein